ncbi:phosphotransferase [Thalassotalea sp. 1_MG-2023]|uniref:aminoglycoside phosphotransferase family protein n=1 Tax=Thalassotalea sp. 1_MG-2023 TaxID=3062680 RepID=UPI0026E28561|nr:phosphotransferase [Thalassotalea sp. 1_MG-2023]MDO6427082.1 phosphotransferase [Thalassotalea sp. 1_MG-2023]
MHDVRQEQLTVWLAEKHKSNQVTLQPLTGDAGFRRYFRFQLNEQSFIAVDSPAQYCNNKAFVQMSQRLAQANVLQPDIFYHDTENGFFCLMDLGDTLLADVLSPETVIEYYQRAIDLLPVIAMLPQQNLPRYDADFVRMELDIFTQWLLKEHLDITLSPEEHQSLATCFDCLVDNALAQPQVVMHRDFHSRNLMCYQQQLAVIDFQDAVIGPVTYDVVSLLRDCYVKWPDDVVEQALKYFIVHYGKQLAGENISTAQWHRWFDLMGIQRHVKAAGIFARLKHRDNKPSYVKDIPLTLHYIVDVCQHYPELASLKQLVVDKVLPLVEHKEVK